MLVSVPNGDQVLSSDLVIAYCTTCFHGVARLSDKYSLQVHMTLITFQGHGFKGQGHRQRFPKIYFSGEGKAIDGLPSKII